LSSAFSLLYREKAVEETLWRDYDVTASLGGGLMEVRGLQRNEPFAILLCVRRSNATDPRYKVFAIAGLLNRLVAEISVVDYGKETQQVFEEATLAALNTETAFWQFRLMDVPPLNALYHIASHSRRSDLPSWVPDWSDTESIIPCLSRIYRWNAAANSRPSFQSIAGESSLLLQGRIASSVSKTFKVDVGYRMQLDKALPEDIVEHHERPKLIYTLEYISIFRNWASEALLLPHLSEPLGLRDAAISILLSFWDNPTMRQDSNEEISRYCTAFVKWLNFLTLPTEPILEHLGIPEQRTGNANTDLLVFLLASFQKYCRERNERDMQVSMQQTLEFFSDYTLFITDDGHTGAAFNAVEKGDQIVIFSGSQLPFIARRNEDETYRLFAPAFVWGYMGGEKWNEEFPLRELVIK
jgi:hypothetical protein